MAESEESSGFREYIRALREFRELNMVQSEHFPTVREALNKTVYPPNYTAQEYEFDRDWCRKMRIEW